MKKFIVVGLVCSCLMQSSGVKAQSAEVQQLLLDVTKLAQFKEILKDLQTSYRVLHKGYSTVKNLAEGNFNLHEVFIDGLLIVNPSLARYRRVADIIRDQVRIVSQYKTAFRYFKTGGWLNPNELDYLGKVYRNLMDKSVGNLDALATVLTSGKLRMTDDERLVEINRLYRDTHEMLGFLTGFNHRVSLLGRQRSQRAEDMRALKGINGGN